jgi:hypothetical protein
MPHLCGRPHAGARRLNTRLSTLSDEGPGLTAAAPPREQIAELAYFYWEARGRQDGSPWEDWFRAEEEWKRRGDR